MRTLVINGFSVHIVVKTFFMKETRVTLDDNPADYALHVRNKFLSCLFRYDSEVYLGTYHDGAFCEKN